MGSVNKIILVGNLGRDAELRYTPSGAAIAKFSLATTEKWNDKSGSPQERTEWHNIDLWGKQAESLSEYLLKGRQVYVEGRLQSRQLRRRHLEDVAVFDRGHAVNRLRRDVDAFAGLHLALLQLAVLLNLEQQPAGVQVNRLVLHVVVLQAQRVSRVDVNQLAHIPIGLVSLEIVPPRFLNTSDLGHDVLQVERGSTLRFGRQTPERAQQLPFDIVDGRETQHAARERPQLFVAQLGEHLFGDRNRARRHAELRETQSHEQREKSGIGRHLAAQ